MEHQRSQPHGAFVPNDRPTHVGIVGLGRIFDLTVLGYRDNADVEVVALCDLDDAAPRATARRVAGARTYRDLDAFLAHDLDVVEVLVPSSRNAEVVCAALDAGHHVNGAEADGDDPRRGRPHDRGARALRPAAARDGELPLLRATAAAEGDRRVGRDRRHRSGST